MPSVVTVYLGCALTMVALAVADARRAGVDWIDASFGAFGSFTVAVAWVDARAVAPAAESTIGQAR